MKYNIQLFLAILLFASCNSTPKFMQCDECDGEGEVVVDCEECNGDGVVECERCNGYGKLRCRECEGEGKVKKECPECEGSGRKYFN